MKDISCGTSHFVHLIAAIEYYAPYGYSADDVHEKIKCGEIALGAPEIKPGEKLVKDPDGRYLIISSGK